MAVVFGEQWVMKMCNACECGEHQMCGMQTWCECECDGTGGWYVAPPGACEHQPSEPHDEFCMPSAALSRRNDGI